MPVQLSEAAIALFRMGQCQVAWELLRSCGLAFSVYTESPAVRRNASASTDAEKPTMCSAIRRRPSRMPSSPACSASAIKTTANTALCAGVSSDENLSLTQDGVVFTAENNRYTMTGAGGWESVEFSVCVPAGSMPVLYCNGESVAYETQPLLIAAGSPPLFSRSRHWCGKSKSKKPPTAHCLRSCDSPANYLVWPIWRPVEASAFSLPGLHHVLLERDGYLLISRSMSYRHFPPRPLRCVIGSC